MQKLEQIVIPAYTRLPYRDLPLFRAAVAVGYTALLTILLLQSSQHPVIGPAAPLEFDLAWEILLTTGHVLGFGFLVVVCWWALAAAAPSHRAVVEALVFALVVGFVTEAAQVMVPDRSVSLFDLGVNWLVALAAAYMLHSRLR